MTLMALRLQHRHVRQPGSLHRSPNDPEVPIHAQAGSNYYDNADKMIVRRVASLPHILIDDIPQQGVDSRCVKRVGFFGFI